MFSHISLFAWSQNMMAAFFVLFCCSTESQSSCQATLSHSYLSHQVPVVDILLILSTLGVVMAPSVVNLEVHHPLFFPLAHTAPLYSPYFKLIQLILLTAASVSSQDPNWCISSWCPFSHPVSSPQGPPTRAYILEMTSPKSLLRMKIQFTICFIGWKIHQNQSHWEGYSEDTGGITCPGTSEF